MGSSGAGHVVLVGLMATGKTTVGRIVADELDRPLHDSDQQVESRTGRTVRDIWRTDGEDAFRELEAEALADALDAPEPSVIAAAGGVVLAERNRRRLKQADVEVVWLRASVDTLLDRVRAADDTHRPLLDDDPAGKLEAMARDRGAFYDDVADVVFDVDGCSPAEVAAQIVRHLGGAT